MQNDIEEELETSSDDAQTAERKHRLLFWCCFKRLNLSTFTINLYQSIAYFQFTGTSVRSPETTVFDPRHENQTLETTNSREA